MGAEPRPQATRPVSRDFAIHGIRKRDPSAASQADQTPVRPGVSEIIGASRPRALVERSPGDGQRPHHPVSL